MYDIKSYGIELTLPHDNSPPGYNTNIFKYKKLVIKIQENLFRNSYDIAQILH
jgi:hypothetical protein